MTAGCRAPLVWMMSTNSADSGLRVIVVRMVFVMVIVMVIAMMTTMLTVVEEKGDRNGDGDSVGDDLRLVNIS